MMSLIAPLLALQLGIAWPMPAQVGPEDAHLLVEPRVLAAPAPYDEVWDRLAACESNGNWSINTGNGYYGGLQFNKMSWDWAVEVGGHDVPAWPHEATREQQIAVAETLLDIHPAGWRAWPACSRKLGL